MPETGQLIVISGPSGVGKGKLCDFLQRAFPALNISVSATSRPRRPGEVDGESYFFKTREQFEAMIEDHALLEWAEYNSAYYGTPRAVVDEALKRGEHVLLEIDVQGAMKVKMQFPEAMLVFIAPPTLDDLQARLKARGQNSTTDIVNRMTIAREELTYQDCFDHVLINGDFMVCSQSLMDLVASRMDGVTGTV